MPMCDDQPYVDRGQFGPVQREHGGMYWDRNAHTVKLSIILLREGDNER